MFLKLNLHSASKKLHDAQAMKSNKLISEMEKREDDLKASIERLQRPTVDPSNFVI